jgi:hypothetical protein
MYPCMYISLYILGLDSAYERTCDVCPSEHTYSPYGIFQ